MYLQTEPGQSTKLHIKNGVEEISPQLTGIRDTLEKELSRLQDSVIAIEKLGHKLVDDSLDEALSHTTQSEERQRGYVAEFSDRVLFLSNLNDKLSGLVKKLNAII